LKKKAGKKQKTRADNEKVNEKGEEKSALRDNLEAIVIAVLLALFIRTFVVQAFKIPSGSMKETLKIGDYILVNKFIYGVKIPVLQKEIIPLKEPERGDIVVFKCPMDPEKDYIKRVIGTEGDVIEIIEKQVYLNGKPMKQDFAKFTDPRIKAGSVEPRDNFGPVKVPEDSLFVMGDNRDNSYDSRFWGFVDLKDVKGKAFIIYFSGIIPWEFSFPWNWDWDEYIIRWGRIGDVLR
jgi:signal peptidase I